MKTQTILVALCIIVSFAAHTDHALAEAYQIDDHTVVFMNTFSIDASYGSFGIPIAADHTVEHNDRVDVLGYKLADAAGETPAIANIADIVLSEAPVVDTKYDLATSTIAAFTLFSLVTFEEAVTPDLTMTITKLPFWVDGRRTTLHQNQLDELKSN